MILLSIIIPVYNAEKYLSKCIESILAIQDMQYEILLIDDGSTDNSGNICDQYEKKYSNIRVFHINNGGPSRARNYGIKMARGEYIQFVDSDDELQNGYIESLKNIFSSNPDIVQGNACVLDRSGGHIRNLTIDKKEQILTKDMLKDITNNEKEVLLHYIWNKFYRKEFLINNKIIFNEELRLGEDFIFNCEVFSASENIVFLGQTMYKYFIRFNGSLSGRFNTNELERRRLMDQTFISLLKIHGVYEYAKEKYDALIGEIALHSVNSISKQQCKFSFIEKVRFVRTFNNSEYYEYFAALLKTGHNKMMNKVILCCLYAKMENIATCIILLRGKLRQIKLIIK